MIWSRLSLTHKLFVAIVLPVLLAVALMAGAVMLSMRAGFSQYLLEAELSRFDGLAEVLAQDPMAEQGWPALAQGSAWADLLAQQVPLPLRREPERHALPPPPEAPQGRPPIQPLPERLALLTPDGTLRAGTRAAVSVHAAREIFDAQGQLLGQLILSPFGQEQAEADALFLARQVWFITLSALLALGVAAAVAAGMAGQFLRPIRAIGRHVGRLAVGDLSARLTDPAGQDELGQMMRDQNRLAETLEQAQKHERQWVSDSSHELKTPLAVMQAQIEAMQDGLRPMNAGSLATLHGAVTRLARLTDDLAVLARGDESAPLAQMSALDLGDLAGQAALDMTPRMERAGLTLTLDLADTALPIRGDAQRLRQVLDNLLDNALHYTRAPGRVVLRCRAEEGHALLTLEDSAPAPPDPDLPRLFERFTRVETSRSRAHGGSGLGLAICHSLVLAHGGQIAALPSDLGGLCIRITLPLEPAHEPYSDR